MPTPDGTALLQQVQDRMHQLHTYQVDETLGPATPPLRAAYSFAAPDRMQLNFGDGETTVWVGPTRYTRDTLSGIWKAEDFGTSLPVPSFVWDIPDSGGTYVGAHIVGADTVDGVETRVLTSSSTCPKPRSGSNCGQTPAGWCVGRRCAPRDISWTIATPALILQSRSSRRFDGPPQPGAHVSNDARDPPLERRTRIEAIEAAHYSTPGILHDLFGDRDVRTNTRARRGVPAL
jgi:hypothetical protein